MSAETDDILTDALKRYHDIDRQLIAGDIPRSRFDQGAGSIVGVLAAAAEHYRDRETKLRGELTRVQEGTAEALSGMHAELIQSEQEIDRLLAALESKGGES